jgi:hypothetical protein
MAEPGGISVGQPDDHRSTEHEELDGGIKASVNSLHGTPALVPGLIPPNTHSLSEMMSYVGPSIKPLDQSGATMDRSPAPTWL